MLAKRVTTAFNVLKAGGLQGVASVSLEKAGMWWRHGEGFDLRKIVGRPADVARVEGCLFALDEPAVSAALRYLLLTGKHEAPERMLVKRHLDPSLPLVELGGALGVVSCIANRRLHHPARHVVVEANPALIPVLARNRTRNRCSFTVVNRAIAYDTATVDFVVHDNVLASGVKAGEGTRVAVATTTLADLVDEHGFETCTLVCDIEGAEVDIVHREGETLGSRVKTLIVEVHDRLVGADVCEGMLARLRSLGFERLEQQWDTIAFRNTRI